MSLRVAQAIKAMAFSGRKKQLALIYMLLGITEVHKNKGLFLALRFAHH